MIASTELRHPQITKNEWVTADSIPEVFKLLEQVAQSTQAPPVSEKVQAKRQAAASEVASSIASAFRKIDTRRKTTALQFLKDFVDPTFQKYVAPTIVMITWWVALVYAAAALGLTSLALLTSLFAEAGAFEAPDIPRGRPPAMPGFEFQLPEVIRDFISGGLKRVLFLLIQITLSLIFLLWMRVVLEVCIVLFHISGSLKRIEENTAHSE